MTNYEVSISQRAYSNLLECVSFVKNVSSNAAKDLYDEIMTSIKSLSDFPNKYPEVEGLLIRQSKIRKMVIHKGRYVILYKVEDGIVGTYTFRSEQNGTFTLQPDGNSRQNEDG